MAGNTRADVLRVMEADGVVPIFYHPQVDVTTRVAEVLVAAGLRTLEFTNRGEGAVAVLADMVRSTRRAFPELIIGAGSIIDGATAAHVIDLGVDFVVAPGFSQDVADACHLRNVSYVPGCGTVTEILTAYRAGCDLVKLFPASSIGGPAFLEAVRAPCPWIRAIPTGGVDPTVDSLRSWYRAGAPAVGIGSKMLPTHVVDDADFAGLRARVDATVAAIGEARA